MASRPGAGSASPAVGGASSSGIGSSTGLMMFLDTTSKSLVHELTRRLADNFKSPTTTDTDVLITDLDGVQYRISIPYPKSKDVTVGRDVTVSMFMPAFKDLSACGVAEALNAIYGDMAVAPSDGSHYALHFDGTGMTAEQQADAIARVAALRRNAVAVPFERAFKSIVPPPGTRAGAAGSAVASGPACPEMVVRFRPNEPVFVLPRSDKVTIIFALEFNDATDRAVARICCQEFVEAQRVITTTPVSFSDKAPPMELAGRKDLPRPSEGFVGYLSFSLFARQVDTEDKRRQAVDLLTNFRSYLDYHIKATKSFLHARMRNRVTGWMQVLNRSVLEDPFETREKKLMSGRTFTGGAGASAGGAAGAAAGSSPVAVGGAGTAAGSVASARASFMMGGRA